MARKQRANLPSQQVEQKRDPYNFEGLSTEELISEGDAHWRKAKLLAERAGGFYGPAIANLIPYSSPGCPTMAVDKYYRCYYNPLWVLELITQANGVSAQKPCTSCGAGSHEPYAYVAGVIWHESQHPLRKHAQRSDIFKPDDHVKMNIANDAEINDDAIEFFAECKKNKSHNLLMCLPPGGVLKEVLLEHNLPLNKVGEYYYNHMPDELVEQYKSTDCGSGGGNARGDYEVDPNADPKDRETQGVTEGAAQAIEREVAKKIIEAKQQGFGSLGGLLDWAKERLPHASYNWARELNHALRSSISRTHGYKKRNFMKFHKKSMITNFNVIHASQYALRPEVDIVIDASGSMGFNGRNKFALAQIDKITRTLKAKCRIMCADDGGCGELQQIKRLADLKIHGGGGTSMRRGILDYLKKSKKTPNLVLLITDGETDYPNQAEMSGAKLIVAVVNESRACMKNVPGWAKGVWIPVKGGSV